MQSKAWLAVWVLCAGMLAAVLGACASVHGQQAGLKAGEEGMKRKPAGPRKVVVGTSMYGTWQQYPGLEKRLQELGELVDEMAAKASAAYPGSRLDIAALPEVAVNGGLNGPASKVSFPLEGPVLDIMGAKARQHGCYIVVPMFMAEDRDKGIYSNAAVLLDRQGKVAGIYRKVYPVSSGDSDRLEGGVAPGRDFPVFDCDFGRMGIQICFDMSYDAGWEALRRKGAELVIWTTQSPGQLNASFRAMKNRYYVLTSTWRNNASLFDPTGAMVREIRSPERVFVEQIDLSYVLIGWQSTLDNGKAFDQKYGNRAGYRYSEAEDGGIFWSNDPQKPIMEMVRELNLELPADEIERNRQLQDKVRGGPPSMD
jgi:predicted amidohydrolase